MENTEKDVVSDAFRRHQNVLNDSLKGILGEIKEGAEILLTVAKGGRCLFICGNGGSAADSAHLATEWVSRYKDDRRPLRAVDLTSGNSVVTAIGNDYGFDNIFSRQIEALGAEGDALLAITTSGRSRNVICAMDEAKQKEMKVILLTGEGGKHLEDTTDVCIAVPSTETARIQEVHELIYHAWCEYIDKMIR